MTSIIEKRLSLHKELASRRQENAALKSQIVELQSRANIASASYMIAHEINNLLVPLSNYAALALGNREEAALVEKALTIAVRNCDRASKIMESTLAMANGQSQEKERVILADLVDDVFACLCRDFARDGITVRIQIPQHLAVWVVPVQMQQVLMNLILNARDAMLPGGGVLTIQASEEADVVRIGVVDTGCGIKPADMDNIFDSFFSTKARGDSPYEYSGSGVGLAFCRRIVDAHDGSISAESEPAKGSTFRITLPKPQSDNR
ncbi:MAG: HAMP domain-containing histidine kinase [Phycisphaerales bacterium]|nr:MAG: HAMP domain-containing histidine kinase [Phycisphaerales bacterium]